jgi:hypothetical protein
MVINTKGKKNTESNGTTAIFQYISIASFVVLLNTPSLIASLPALVVLSTAIISIVKKEPRKYLSISIFILTIILTMPSILPSMTPSNNKYSLSNNDEMKKYDLAESNMQSSKNTFQNSNFDIVNQLSYCGASALAQSIWNRKQGNYDVADTLEKGTIAYGNLAIEFGSMNQIDKENVIQLNKKNNTKVSEEVKNGNFFNASLAKRNTNCLDLVKENPTLLGMWQRHFN